MGCNSLKNNSIEVPENGIILVYLSNQSVANVFFDNLVVSMEAGSLLEERHYYPYGLPIQGWGSTAAGSLSNRQLYQGNEYRQEAGLNWMDFHNRQYDPQLGRFLGIDPLADQSGQQTLSPYHAMGCNPALMVDPL
ncbi:MAG TPA: RHS repeat-associated core domain-containing protein [Edaphocola sp.]|nr:RHS repeat-associated core domain-containing protein [Edaphocola sp.]